jgi:hypothetical protein
MPSQNEIILNYLKSGQSISSIEALNLFGCFRLASRISDIRKKYPELKIQVNTIHNELTKKHYASYKLIVKEEQLTFI